MLRRTIELEIRKLAHNLNEMKIKISISKIKCKIVYSYRVNEDGDGSGGNGHLHWLRNGKESSKITIMFYTNIFS